VIGVQDFAFMGGSMGMAVGEAFIAGARARLKACPYVIFTAAGGARMQEGILSLMQMPKHDRGDRRTARCGPALYRGDDRPHHGRRDRQLCHAGRYPDCGAQGADRLCRPARDQDTIREKLPEGFQRAEYLLEHGMLDMVVERKDMRATLAKLVDYLVPEKKAA
jgi:acetyl-CoA carboxylase carboxyl transferase subunit beta